MNLSVVCANCLCSLSLWERARVSISRCRQKPLTLTLSQGEGRPLSWAPSADAVAGEGTERTSQNQRDSALERRCQRDVQRCLTPARCPQQAFFLQGGCDQL